MGEIREPWASGFGYGGLAKRVYTAGLRSTTTQEQAMDKGQAESPLVGATEAIGKALEEQGVRLRDLEQRLHQVLRPASSDGEQVGQKVEGVPTCSPIETMLDDLLGVVIANTAILEDILSRMRS